MKVYISGPIASEPKGFNYARARFAETANELRLLGHEPVNPFGVGTCNYHRELETECEVFRASIATFYSDSTNASLDFPEANAPHSWSCYLRWDIRAMLECDAVAMLDGWECSPGARLENFVALQCGVPVHSFPYFKGARDFSMWLDVVVRGAHQFATDSSLGGP